MRFRDLSPAEKRMVALCARVDARRILGPDATDEEIIQQIKTVPTHYGMKLTDFYDIAHRRTVNLFDDWITYVDTQVWTKGTAGAGSPSVTNSDNLNGLLTLATGTTANDEAWVATTRKNWIVTASCAMVFETRINYQEANTNNAAIFCGMTDSFASGLMAAGGASLKSSFTGFGIYKIAGVSGTQYWRTVSSVTTTQTTNLSVTNTQPNVLTTAFGDQILRICVNPISTTVAEVTYFVNDVQLRATASPGTTYPIKDQYTFASTKLAAGCYAQGASTTSETINNDYICVENLRGGTN